MAHLLGAVTDEFGNGGVHLVLDRGRPHQRIPQRIWVLRFRLLRYTKAEATTLADEAVRRGASAVRMVVCEANRCDREAKMLQDREKHFIKVRAVDD